MVASTIAQFGMSPVELAKHLCQLARDIEIGSPPTGEKIVEIREWTPARRAVLCLAGRPVGHPLLPDSKPIFTSELFLLDPERRLARTWSRWYRLLDEVGPEYWTGGRAERP